MCTIASSRHTHLDCTYQIYLSPDLQQVLDLNKSSGITKQGLSAGAVSQTQSLVELNDVSLCCGKFDSGEEFFQLPGPLHAIVSDFPQEQ